MENANVERRGDESRVRHGYGTARVYTPPADIIEFEEGIKLMLDMPGAASDGLNIEIKDNVLSISGRTKRSEVGGQTLQYREFEEGDYHRSFTISDGFDPERVEAKLKDGVLMIVLPKAERLKPRKITVRAE